MNNSTIFIFHKCKLPIHVKISFTLNNKRVTFFNDTSHHIVDLCNVKIIEF